MNSQTPIKAAVWSLVERFSSQVVGFLIGIVLARLLDPHDFGIVGMMTIFLSISNVFIDSGFGNALIRKQNRTEQDLSTAFYFNVILGAVVYAILWIISPLIASFFREPLLAILVKIAGLNVLLFSFSVVQTAILTAELKIKQQTIINLCGQIPAGIIAILIAYNGGGVYTLAFQSVIAAAIKLFLLWYYAKWRPTKTISLSSLKYLWGFGSKLVGASLIGTIFNECYSVLIGKFVGAVPLGFYTKASQLNSNVNSISTGVVNKIAVPMLSRYQEDISILKDKFRELMQVLVMLTAPITIILCVCAKDIIIVLWTEKWTDSIILFQLLLIGGLFAPIGQVSLALLQVVNKTGLILKLELPKKIIYTILIGFGFRYGVVGLCVSQIFINIAASVINMYPTKSILGFSYGRQVTDILKYIILALLLGVISYIVTYKLSLYIRITLNTLFISAAYIIILLLLKDSIATKYIRRFIHI